MEQLIPVINKLQDVFNAIGQPPINLPQIVLFNMPTRAITDGPLSGAGSRPARSRREAAASVQDGNAGAGGVESDEEENKTEGGERADEWGEFLHRPGRKYYDFSEIRAEIVRETERTAGRNKGIHREPITLKIYSPRVLNLTMVDLPGLTKVPVGDQPSDIELQVRQMCLEFVGNPSAIILAVTEATIDPANSDALKLAREVDPEGGRTIGVLTKLDLMDPGTDALDVLLGRVIPLRRGFVGVVNRSQKDIQEERSIEEALDKEQRFFSTHPTYRSMANRMGTRYLARMLNTILMHHIRDCLPDIKSRITSMLMDLQHEIDGLGEPVEAQTRATQGGLLLSLLSRFASNFADAIDGRGAEGLELNELYGGARIAYIFNEIFSTIIMSFDPFDGLSDDDIRTAIRNATGPRPSLFVPEASFEILVRRQIRRLEPPGLQCVELVYEELQRVAAQCETPELRRFGELREKVIDVVHSMLRRALVPTQTMVSNLIHIELSHINTSHPDFIGGSRAVTELMERFQEEGEDGFAPPLLADRTEEEEEGFGDAFLASAAAAREPPTFPPAAGRAAEASPFTQTSQTMVSPGWRGTLTPAGPGSVARRSVGRSVGAGDVYHARRLRSRGSPGSVVGWGGADTVKLPQMPTSVRQADTRPTERERIETEIIKSLLASYFRIVQKNFMDLVPKTIMCFLVNHARENIQSELVRVLYTEPLFDELLRETDTVATRRRACMEMRSLLAKALEIVHEVRDFNVFK